jgi:hypothetical protein
MPCSVAFQNYLQDDREICVHAQVQHEMAQCVFSSYMALHYVPQQPKTTKKQKRNGVA